MDEKRRVVLPRDVAEELGLVEGSAVTFKKGKGVVIVRRAETTEDELREIMSWNPKRAGKLTPVKERELKEIWR